MGLWNPLIAWTVAHVLYPQTLVIRRKETAVMQDKGCGILADGVFRIHLASPSDWLGGFAACGAYVESMHGGAHEAVTCRACKRIIRKAKREN